jgi:membrane-bound metal-dependent hydrolase YbcI (DUF457 family)
MPFTPLHMGPGLAVKAVLNKKFSLMVFGWSQIVIDLQPLFVLLTGHGELHGFSHTLLGATLIGLLCRATGKHLGELGLHILREPRRLPINWGVSFVSAFIGTYSHIFIDSLMHVDVLPLLPISRGSPLHGIISINDLHVLCLVAAVVGGLAWYGVDRWTRRRRKTAA